MGFKGTKGDWIYLEKSHGQFIMCGNYCVAKLNDYSGNEETKSNAKLIESSPKILESLQELVGFMDECSKSFELDAMQEFQLKKSKDLINKILE